MGRFSNTTYKNTVESIVHSVKETLNNPYYLWANKSPTIVDYYNINLKASTLDEGSLVEYNDYGEDSPIKYNLVKDFVLYGIDQIQTALNNDEYGLQADTISGEAYILPNTIKPCSGDYFRINYMKEKLLFSVIEVSFDTMDNGNNMYKITYELSPDPKVELDRCIFDTYKFIVQNIGTDFNCIIKDTIMDQIDILDNTVEALKEYFVTLFYNERVQTFIFSFLEHNFYDPYMIEFIIRNNIINYDGSDFVYIGHQTQLKPMFPINYKRTLFYALETKDLKGIRKYVNKAKGTAITNRMTTFYNRPEVYFEIDYEPITKDWGIIPTFFDELYEHIESAKPFIDMEDGNFNVYNIIIKYFNDLPITKDDLDVLDHFYVQDHHMLFYAIPAIIFCLNEKLDRLMEKE